MPTKREIVYSFLNLSFIRQTEILVKLNLLDEDDKVALGKVKYVEIIDKIMNKVDEMDCLEEFMCEINK